MVEKITAAPRISDIHSDIMKMYIGLDNELKTYEIESKLVFDKNPNIPDVINKLYLHFLSPRENFTLWKHLIVMATNIVAVYESPTGGFSITEHSDGPIWVKKKGEKKYLDNSVSSRTEDKIDIPPGNDPVAFASRRYNIPMGSIKYIGSYVREKTRILVINKTSKRIYTINIDDIVSNNDTRDQVDYQATFNQLEIKYKGRLPKAIKLNENTNKSEEKITQDVFTLKNHLISFSREAGFPLQPSKLTKRDWLKKQNIS